MKKTSILLLTALSTVSEGCYRFAWDFGDTDGASSGSSTTHHSTSDTTVMTSGPTSTTQASSMTAMSGTTEENSTTTSANATTDPGDASTSTSDADTSTSDSETDGDTGCIGCVYPCGNGKIDGAEQCDQGSKNGNPITENFNDIECTNTCTVGALRAFITSKPYNGNLGGIEGADETCQNLARNKKDPELKNPDNFIAWLAGPDEYNAYNILKDCDFPYYRLDNSRLAQNGASIISSPNAPESHFLTITEEDKPIEEGVDVWSCIGEDGADACGEDQHCGEWDSLPKQHEKVMGRVGRSGDRDINIFCNTKHSNKWTDCNKVSCSNPARLYCFEKCPSP